MYSRVIDEFEADNVANANGPIPELLMRDGFLTLSDRKKIDDFSVRSGLSFIKIALNFGYVSRKNYERSLTNVGYKFQEIRELPFDPEVLRKIDLKFADQHVAIPLRIENNKVITIMTDPSDELFADFIRFTYDLEPEIIVASDLDIVWLSNKLLGGKYVKAAVFDLLNRDPANSALMTFSPAQLVILFISLGIVVS